MYTLLNSQNEHIAFIENMMILDAAKQKVIGIIIGDCFFGKKNHVIGKIFNDHAYLVSGEIIGKVPKSNEIDVDRAVKSAKEALPYWSSLTHNQRADWLDKIADCLELKYENIAYLESKDTGKPISLAREVDAYRSVKNFRFFAT